MVITNDVKHTLLNIVKTLKKTAELHNEGNGILVLDHAYKYIEAKVPYGKFCADRTFEKYISDTRDLPDDLSKADLSRFKRVLSKIDEEAFYLLLEYLEKVQEGIVEEIFPELENIVA